MPKQTTEEIRAEFYKLFTYSHPGDSGMGGNESQEPIWEMIEDPKEIANYWLDKMAEQVALAKKKEGERAKKFIEGVGCEKCSSSLLHNDIHDKEIYYYFDLGGWTRVFCEEHVPRADTKELAYGAEKVSSLLTPNETTE